MASVVVLLHLDAGTEAARRLPVASSWAHLGRTGYMTFVKVCELIGGILVMIPRTRNFGLLVLGPIIVNILAFRASYRQGSPERADHRGRRARGVSALVRAQGLCRITQPITTNSHA